MHKLTWDEETAWKALVKATTAARAAFDAEESVEKLQACDELVDLAVQPPDKWLEWYEGTAPRITIGDTEVSVPRINWIDFLTKCQDIFTRSHCGYWLRAVACDADLGWLVWEDDQQHHLGEEPNRHKALLAWKVGEALPKDWHRLDEAAAIKAFAEGCKRWGVTWFEDKGDSQTYDTAVQLALLGELKY